MKIVLDTNVFISGIFFSGPPSQIKITGYQGITVFKPREFVYRYLN